ncbi:protein-tyrosine phosphatase-like protein, partial [Lasiosphaeria miniovina]
LNPPSISEIAPRLFLGNFSSSYDVETLKKHSITSTLSLMTEKSPRWMDPHVQHHVSAARRLFIPAVDADWMDILSKLDEICEFIDKQLAMPIGTVPGGVLVHCRMGISRSATVVIAYLMKKHGQSVDEALAAVRAKRRIVSPNAGFLEQLQAWGKIKYDLWEVPGKVPKREYTEFLRRWDERQEAAKRK